MPWPAAMEYRQWKSKYSVETLEKITNPVSRWRGIPSRFSRRNQSSSERYPDDIKATVVKMILIQQYPLRTHFPFLAIFADRLHLHYNSSYIILHIKSKLSCITSI